MLVMENGVVIVGKLLKSVFFKVLVWENGRWIEKFLVEYLCSIGVDLDFRWLFSVLEFEVRVCVLVFSLFFRLDMVENLIYDYNCGLLDDKVFLVEDIGL